MTCYTTSRQVQLRRRQQQGSQAVGIRGDGPTDVQASAGLQVDGLQLSCNLCSMAITRCNTM